MILKLLAFLLVCILVFGVYGLFFYDNAYEQSRELVGENTELKIKVRELERENEELRMKNGELSDAMLSAQEHANTAEENVPDTENKENDAEETPEE